MTIPFIKYRKLWVWIAVITAGICVAFVAMWGLKPSIDFTGGTLLELSFSKTIPTNVQMQAVLDDLSLKNVTLQQTGDKGFIMRMPFLSEDEHQLVLKKMREQFQKDENLVREEGFETIGAAVSNQLRQRALWAIILVNLGIILYIGYAFRKVSKPIASWKYGALAIVALSHDLLVVLGAFAVLGHFKGIEVDIGFVVALLTVLGFSVHDTIVVYDRTRENLFSKGHKQAFAEIVNDGLNQTLMRSINTTMTTLLSLLALYFFGGASIQNFALALLIGIASGAYSSIFIASPLLVIVEEWQRKKTV